MVMKIIDVHLKSFSQQARVGTDIEALRDRRRDDGALGRHLSLL